MTPASGQPRLLSAVEPPETLGGLTRLRRLQPTEHRTARMERGCRPEGAAALGGSSHAPTRFSLSFPVLSLTLVSRSLRLWNVPVLRAVITAVAGEGAFALPAPLARLLRGLV